MKREDALREIETTQRGGRRANLSGANLGGAYLIGANLRGANLRCADLRGANLYGANLSGANLYGADLRGANLSGANLIGADLRGANLSGANLSGADLSGANLRGANLRCACLSSASLRGANLSGAHLSDARLPSPQVVLSADWGNVSDALCLALMRYDCASCPDGKLRFAAWAAGGPCPYPGVRFERAARFSERLDLWSYGPPKSPITLVEMVLDEKCPGWSSFGQKAR
jgi:hypothetical protein